MTTTPLNASRVAAGEAAVTSREGFDLDELRSIVEVEVSLEGFLLADLTQPPVGFAAPRSHP